MIKENVVAELREVVHPEFKQDIVTLGMVDSININADNVQIILISPKVKDPFSRSISRSVETAIAAKYPDYAGKISVIIKEATPKKPLAKKDTTTTTSIKNIIAVASGKGGVGKSTITANLAVALSKMGYKVGILDADIYGPSMPKMFGLEGYMPDAVKQEGRDRIIPAEKNGIKIMSIGFFIAAGDALVWRGPMATSALKQMIHDTLWGELDFLMIDLPPGTGDVHLTIISELKVTGAVIVSTPQQIALADVVRGIKMFTTENINIPVIGLVENMAWFTPAELPNNRYYIFGKEGCQDLAESLHLPLLGKIPIVQSICEGGDSGNPEAQGDSVTAKAFHELAEAVVHNIK